MKLAVFSFYIVAMTAAVTDWRKHRIPNGCCVAIVFIVLMDCFWGNHIPFMERALGCVAVSMPMFLLAFCVRGSFGGGDVKFTAVCGLFLGWKIMLVSIVYAIGMAGVYALVLLCRGNNRKACVPLGPFLVFGMTVAIIRIL